MLGENDDQAADEKEPLLVYVMSRLRGITHLDFILANERPDNAEENFAARRNLMKDIARSAVNECLVWRGPDGVK